MYLNSTISGFYPMMHRLYAVLCDDTSWYLWDLEVLQFKDILTSSRFLWVLKSGNDVLLIYAGGFWLKFVV